MHRSVITDELAFPFLRTGLGMEHSRFAQNRLRTVRLRMKRNLAFAVRAADQFARVQVAFKSEPRDRDSPRG